MKSKLVLALALFAFAGLASAAEVPSFDELDADGQGVVTRDEAEQHPEVVASFDEIDMNNDGVLDRAEYAQWRAMREDEEQAGAY